MQNSKRLKTFKTSLLEFDWQPVPRSHSRDQNVQVANYRPSHDQPSEIPVPTNCA